MPGSARRHLPWAAPRSVRSGAPLEDAPPPDPRPFPLLQHPGERGGPGGPGPSEAAADPASGALRERTGREPGTEAPGAGGRAGGRPAPPCPSHLLLLLLLPPCSNRGHSSLPPPEPPRALGLGRLPGTDARAASAAAGGPSTAATARAAEEAARGPPETWLDSLWASAAGLLRRDQEEEEEEEEEEGAAAAAASSSRAAGLFCSLGQTFEDHVRPGDQLSTQLYRNKQLQDTLLQKEEELARLQEENHHLRQFLNSALVKQLEEKTKLLLQNNQRWGAFQTGKRRLKAEDPPLPHEESHPQKARRNLLADFSARTERPHPSVDSWVLHTLGLKDMNTIDSTSHASANYSASSGGLAPGSFLGDPMSTTTDLGVGHGQAALYAGAALYPSDSTANAQKVPLPDLPECPASAPHLPPTSSAPPWLPGGSGCHPQDLPLTPKDVAFTASLSPHCNVKTHTFRQGQAFVRRDADGGWKLTWVPKQPE